MGTKTTLEPDGDFFRHCPALLFVADHDGVAVQLSESLAGLLGSGARQGTKLSERVHPDDRVAFDAAWAELARNDKPTRFDFRLNETGGGHRTYACHARRSSASGHIHGWLQEVPREAAESLRLARILLAIQEHVPLVVWEVDRQGTFIHHAGKGLEGAGLEQGQLLGTNIFDGSTNRPEILAIVRRALEGQPGHSVSESYGTIWETWHIPVREARGEITSVVGITLDITEAKRNERDLKEKIDRIEEQRRIIQSLSTPIIEVWDRVLALPMLGIVDSGRAAEVMDNLLTQISQRRARFAVLDLTGVGVVDTGTAQNLLQLVKAIRLLGAEGIITGIQPAVAQTMTTLGLDLRGMITLASLRDAINLCIERMRQAPA